MTAPVDLEPVLGPEPDGPLPLCPDVETWVEHVYATTYVRRITQSQRWCAQWWNHAEAIVRLTALWQTWESAAITPGPGGMADWLRIYLPVLQPPLLSPDGPFASCTPDRHVDQAPLPLEPAPPGYWAVTD